MQIHITPEVGFNLPGKSLMERFPRVEFLSHIGSDEHQMRCLVQVEFTRKGDLRLEHPTFTVLNVVEELARSAVLEVVLSGPVPRIFASLDHVWWVSPTYLDQSGFVLTIRGTRTSLRTVRSGLSALMGEGYKLKLGAQSLYNAAFMELLPDRQRMVLDKAVELGYYDRPRGCTQRTIAEALNIKQATVSEHLQSAEATIIHAFVTEP
jgi:hypothetical protein